MATRSRTHVQNPEVETNAHDTVKKSGFVKYTSPKPKNIAEEEENKCTKEEYEEIKYEDMCPRHLRFSEEDLKLVRKWKMCRFYGHHLTCQTEKKNGKCEFLHDHLIRGVYDLMELNKKNKAEVPLDELRHKLVDNFDGSDYE